MGTSKDLAVLTFNVSSSKLLTIKDVVLFETADATFPPFAIIIFSKSLFLIPLNT
jgi:hypothetical protein